MSAQPLEVRMAHLEGAYEQINERLRGIDGRLTALDQKIDSRFDAFDRKMDVRFAENEKRIDARFDKQDARFDKQDARFDAFDRKLTAMIFGYFGTSGALTAAIIGVILTHH